MLAHLLALVLSTEGGMPFIAPGHLEGRPPRSEASPLQALIDAAAPGAVVEVEPGLYRGDLYIDHPLRLVGKGRPKLVGSGKGSVIRIRASSVAVEGLDIDGLAGGDMMADSSGVHAAAPNVIVRDCHIANTLFGIYLRETPGARIENNVIRGMPGKAAGEKGSGIHIWNTIGFTFAGNDIADARDGIYIQNASEGMVRGNVARQVRYGLHYMSSDDNVFEDNLFENSAAGAVLMFSRRLQFRRNQFLHNRGFASVGLLFKDLSDSVAEDNLIADNARGVFLEGSSHNVFRNNVIAGSDVALVIYGSCSENQFEGNAFLGNLTPLTLFARRTDTLFEGNYWSENDEPDLDGDGRSDRPYRLVSLFDHLRGNLTAADLMTQSPAAAALAAAERTFPVLGPVEVVDPAPLARPPRLPDVPRVSSQRRRFHPLGAAGSVGLVAFGFVALRARRGSGRRRGAL